jgi:hypothetical protein
VCIQTGTDVEDREHRDFLSLAGQPLHKREEGSGIVPIRELFQSLAVTQRVQNHTCTWLVSVNGRDSPSYMQLLNKKICHLIGQLMRLGRPHNIGDDVERSDWAALQAAAGTTRV